jgi:hypothetical protein
MMAVPIKLSPTLALGRPAKLFDWQKFSSYRSGPMYDVAPDGRFLMPKNLAQNPDGQTNVSLIVNWLRTLQGHR